MTRGRRGDLWCKERVCGEGRAKERRGKTAQATSKGNMAEGDHGGVDGLDGDL